jgi:hypothetical protein
MSSQNFPQGNFVYNNLSHGAEVPNISSPSNVSDTNQRDSHEMHSTKLQKEGRVIISKSSICLIFVFMTLVCFIILLCNLFFTINAFDDNKVITLKPELICKQFIAEHNSCLNQYKKVKDSQKSIDECLSQSLNLQYCYDKVYYYNKKCHVYFSEFEKCVRDNKKIDESLNYLRSRCSPITKDIQRCTSDYMTIDPFVLLINHS